MGHCVVGHILLLSGVYDVIENDGIFVEITKRFTDIFMFNLLSDKINRLYKM